MQHNLIVFVHNVYTDNKKKITLGLNTIIYSFLHMTRQPMPIVVLAILYAIAGLINIITGPIYLMAAGLGIIKGLGIIIIIIGICYFLVSWGLWTMKSWARRWGIIPLIIGLLAFPVGTIISIILLILWLLFKKEISNAL